MKPMMIVPVGHMTTEAIKLLNDNGICCVEAKEPGLVKFVDPLPSVSSRTEIEDAAIKLSRYLLDHRKNTGMRDQKDISALFTFFLSQGTPLDPSGSIAEKTQQVFSEAKLDEIAKIAREEAREERRLAKEAKAKAKESK